MDDVIAILGSFAGAVGDSPVLSGLWAAYKALALASSLAAIVGIIIITIKSQRFYERRNVAAALRVQSAPTPTVKQAVARADWERIIQRLATEEPKNYLRAILEADSLCDYILKVNGFPGESMGERMKAIKPGQLSNLEDFWRAHKIRNEIAHDPNRPISPSEGDVVMRIYEHVLLELEGI